MGAEPYWYFVEYEADTDAALQKLRKREFWAGRYNPVMPFLEFPITPDSPSPGARHRSVQAALEDAAEDGTRSILDIERVADEADFMVAAPLPDGVLESLYVTTQPTRQMVEENMGFLEELERGHCVYIILYKSGKPSEILFAGYSFD